MNKNNTSQEEIVDLLFQSGTAKLDNKQYYESISDFTKALSINFNHIAANYQMVYSLCALRKYEEALFYANKIVELYPYWDTYNQRAFVRENMGDFNGAAADREMSNSIPKDDCWC